MFVPSSTTATLNCKFDNSLILKSAQSFSKHFKLPSCLPSNRPSHSTSQRALIFVPHSFSSAIRRQSQSCSCHMVYPPCYTASSTSVSTFSDRPFYLCHFLRSQTLHFIPSSGLTSCTYPNLYCSAFLPPD